MAYNRLKIDKWARRLKGHHSSFKDLKKMMNRYVRHLPFEDTPTHKSSCKYYVGYVTSIAIVVIMAWV